MKIIIAVSTLALLALAAACETGSDIGNAKITTCKLADDPAPAPKSAGPTGDLDKLNHIVVLYLENHSYDNLYGEFPNSENLKKAHDATGAMIAKQVDPTGSAYAVLPQVVDTSKNVPDGRFPATLANDVFPFEKYVQPNQTTPDLVHRWYQEPLQINGGKMDKFVTISDAKGAVMGFWHTAELPMYVEASNYTVADHFFHAAFGGSFLNHQWLIAARNPVFANPPTSDIAQIDSKGNVTTDGFVTPNECWVVNTAFSVNTPHPASSKSADLVPQQTHATIGDRLSEKNLDWAWYSGGWNDAVAGNADASAASNFQYHHQPFAYFANYADGTPGRKAHLKDETDFMAAAKAGTLPAVSFVKPVGNDNEHPGYANLAQGEKHVISLIDAVRSGPNWKDTVIIVTYDENGGQFDHVAPPKVDQFGPGTRVPTIIISPYAKKSFVDSTVYDTTSILATIEHRWGLDPLSSRDAAAKDLKNALDFTQ